MKKLQQFYIMKFSSTRLDKFGYHLKRILGNSGFYIRDIRQNGELIALADNQALRIIRDIRYKRNPSIMQYDPFILKDLYEQKKNLKRKNFDDYAKKQISIINGKIDEMLFIPEYISVVIDDVKHYRKIIKDGVYINGFKYLRLMCSAGQARVNTVILVREDFEEELKQRLRCGAKSVKITKNKYNAYFALSSSATYSIPKPKVFLIDDCEIEMDKKVDWISKIPPEEKGKIANNEKVTEAIKTLTFNLFDGCGAISVEFAKKIAEELELDYLPSAFCIRCAYVKGMVFVVDFKQYAAELGIEKVIDLYGNEQNISEVDMILTKSQFKLWNAYDSIESYDELCKENGMMWGVTKVTPKYDDNCFRSNYQFCQAIDLMNDDDVAELCDPTVKWLNGISVEDPYQSILFLLGKLCDKFDVDHDNIFDLTSDNVAKSLIVNPEMIKEEYIKSNIIMSINKKIRETYLGKLLLDGNFSVMIPDMYAFMQHAFGQTVTGALKEFEYYSHFWNQKGKKDVVAMRSPLTWRSEVNKLNLKNNELTEKWFKYLTSGIVYNVWGCDCIIHADSDFDGDIVATTDNSVFLRCRYDNLPITYTKSTVDKEYINEDELYQADIQSFNSTIGQITNISTSFYELLAFYENDKTHEDAKNEIIERLKLIRKAQGDAIDKAKGIKIEKMPKHWTKKINKKPEGMDSEKLSFYNKIVADRKPYFFRYLYSAENEKYIKYLDKENDFCLMKFKKKIQDILETPKDELTEDERDYLEEKFYKYSPLIDYNGRMNRVCHYMEDHLSEIKRKRQEKTPEHLIKMMYSGNHVNFPQEDIDYMNAQYLDYKGQKDDLRVKRKSNYTHTVSQTTEFIKYPSAIRDRISDRFISDIEYACDLAIYVCYELHPSRTKDFCWSIFGNQIVRNIQKHTDTPPKMPVLDEQNGTMSYLGKRYKIVEVNV